MAISKKIAVISASTPANGNTGMVSVEFGALVLEKHFPEAELTWITFPSKPGSVDNAFAQSVRNRIRFAHLPESLERLDQYDVILYWGDFLNSRVFVRFSAANQAKAAGIDYNKRDLEDMLFRAFLLEGFPAEILSRVILFGSTILSNSQEDLEDERYQKAFTRLVENAAGVYMRDPISASRVQALRRDSESCLGIDPALLQEHGPMRGVNERNPQRVGLFVGARTMVPRKLPDLINYLENQCGKEIVWIPWLPDRKKAPQSSVYRYIKDYIKRVYPSKGIRMKAREYRRYKNSVQQAKAFAGKYSYSNNCSYHDLLSLVASCGSVITDTYHLVLNSWRMEIPVLCIGNAEPDPASYLKGTLTDLKKFIFHYQFQANQFYCTSSILEQEDVFTSVERMLKENNNHHFCEIKALAKQAEERLAQRINEIPCRLN